ncbi:MAG: SDR family oxidoreductase [Chlorobium sp.]|nr:MAG: SDR family oxidoreductase [Chlorobium sp.]
MHQAGINILYPIFLLKEQEDVKTERNTTPGSLGVVLTGGSSGLGYAMVSRFLSFGDRVAICGRNPEKLDDALRALRAAYPYAEVYGMVCDVSIPSNVREFSRFVSGTLGRVDRWINNAGSAGRLKRPLWELSDDDIVETCNTNLSGSILMCAEAVEIMDRQPTAARPVYHIFNLGFSAAGAFFSRSGVAHKASKRGVAELTRFLSKELRSSGKTSIGVHELSPGLVMTPLLLRDAPERAIRIFYAIAEEPEIVASVMVPKIRSIEGTNHRLVFRPMPLTLARLALSVFR